MVGYNAAHPWRHLLECMFIGTWWPKRNTKLNNLFDKRLAWVGSFIKIARFLTGRPAKSSELEFFSSFFLSLSVGKPNSHKFSVEFRNNVVRLSYDSSFSKQLNYINDAQTPKFISDYAWFVWLHSNDNITYLFESKYHTWVCISL